MHDTTFDVSRDFYTYVICLAYNEMNSNAINSLATRSNGSAWYV